MIARTVELGEAWPGGPPTYGSGIGVSFRRTWLMVLVLSRRRGTCVGTRCIRAKWLVLDDRLDRSYLQQARV